MGHVRRLQGREGHDHRVARASGRGWKKLTDFSDETLAEAQYSSNSRLDTPESREGVYVYDLGAHGIDPGTLYKNGFNWVQQPFAPELVVNGGTQVLAEYPNGNGCSTKETDCHLWGTGAKWGAAGPRDLMNVDLDARFGPESAWNGSGTTPGPSSKTRSSNSRPARAGTPGPRRRCVA